MNAKDILRHVAPKIESQIDALELALAMIDVAFETTTWTEKQSANLKTESFNTVRIFIVSAINSLFKNNSSGVYSIFHDLPCIESAKPQKTPPASEESDIEKRIARIIRAASTIWERDENEISVQVSSIYSTSRFYHVGVKAVNEDDEERNLYRASGPCILKAISFVEEDMTKHIATKKSEIRAKFDELNGLAADLVPADF